MIKREVPYISYQDFLLKVLEMTEFLTYHRKKILVVFVISALLISIPAGMSHMPFWKFMFYSSLGTIIWTTFLASVGFYFGENQILMQQIFSQASYIILSLLAIFLLWLAYRRYRHKRKSY